MSILSSSRGLQSVQGGRVIRDLYVDFARLIGSQQEMSVEEVELEITVAACTPRRVPPRTERASTRHLVLLSSDVPGTRASWSMASSATLQTPDFTHGRYRLVLGMTTLRHTGLLMRALDTHRLLLIRSSQLLIPFMRWTAAFRTGVVFWSNVCATRRYTQLRCDRNLVYVENFIFVSNVSMSVSRHGY